MTDSKPSPERVSLPKLYHYRSSPFVGPLENRPQQDHHKPTGLWVSCCEDKDYEGKTWGWWDWCQSEKFREESLVFRHTVTIRPDANILHLKTPSALHNFTHVYAASERPMQDMNAIDWDRVRADHQGLVISPYQWTERLELMWYYGWDCASGCIWDVSAIESIVCDMPDSLIERLSA